MNISNDRPAYRNLNPEGFFGPNDHLYKEDECFYYDGEPNEHMEPLNKPARERLIAYLEKLDAYGREAAAKVGRQYAGRPRDLDGALVLARQDERNRVAIMNAPKTVTSIESVVTESTPEVGNANPKKPGRPAIKQAA